MCGMRVVICDPCTVCAASPAAGNVAPVGDGLDDNDGLCTWLSTDGGATWDDVAEGAFIYEYADWGGILLMTKHAVSGPADEVRWQRCWLCDCLSSLIRAFSLRAGISCAYHLP